ncbi:MAG: Rieske 2Fe-2S domain-containing protein [Deltaproteobacteria bacterium]|nr:Rieske 2Fe-2S domain-containing protein [Deltaproteobacteria bacterium]
MQDVNRKFWQRILGIPQTGMPTDPGCWTMEDGKVVINLARAPELKEAGGALRLEGPPLPGRYLVVKGADGSYHAFENRCTHLGHRRLDPLPGGEGVQCCSVNKSTYNLSGEKLKGPAPRDVKSFPVSVEGEKLVVHVS